MQFTNSKSKLGFPESSAFLHFTSKATCKTKKESIYHSLPFFITGILLNQNFDTHLNYKTILLSDFNTAI